MKTARHIGRLVAASVALAGVVRVARATEYTIGDSRIAVSVSAEKPAIILGEPAWIVFRIAKVSGTDFTFTRDIFESSGGTADIPSYRIVVRGSDGATVGQPLRPQGRAYSGPGPRPFTVTAAAPYEYRLFLPAWAVFERPGAYTIDLRRALSIRSDALGNSREWELVEAVANVRVGPPDADQMRKIIDDLGGVMLQNINRDGFEAAYAALSQINDERVIPYFRDLIRNSSASNNSARGFQPLAKFDSDEALQIMKAGLDAENENMRRSAARALAQSRHPKAMDVLLTHIDDPLSDVRQSVMNALAAQPPEEARPYLRKLSGDANQWIASESKRYIDLMGKPGYAPPTPGAGPRIVRRGNEVIVRMDARPEDVAGFTDIRGVEKLTFTRDQAGPLTYLTEANLTPLEHWPDLKSIELGPMPISDEVLTQLALMPHLESIPRAFPNPWITKTGKEAFVRMRGLAEVWLTEMNFKDDEIAQFATHSAIRRLYLPPVGDRTIEALTPLRDLEVLSIGTSPQLTDAGMEQVAKFTKLVELDLQAPAVTDSGYGNLAKLKSLKRLQIYAPAIGDPALAAIAEIPGLESLMLQRATISAAGVVSLSSLAHLKDLSLQRAQMPALPTGLSALNILRADDVGLTDAGVAGLRDMSKLQSALLNKNAITNAGVANLAGAKGITNLDLSDTLVDDGIMDVLAGLPELGSLSLRNTKVTAAGLAKLAGLKKLSSLSLYGTPAAKDPEAVKRLFPGVPALF